MLAALTSRWITTRFCVWRWSSPHSASRHTWAIAPSSKGWPIERIVSRTEPRSQYSITIHSSFGFGNEPWARTMYGESHRCSSFSSFFSSLDTSFGAHGSTFTATSPSPSRVVDARYTIPYDPLPSSSCSVTSSAVSRSRRDSRFDSRRASRPVDVDASRPVDFDASRDVALESDASRARLGVRSAEFPGDES